MAEIFLSYANEDRETAFKVAALLDRPGGQFGGTGVFPPDAPGVR